MCDDVEISVEDVTAWANRARRESGLDHAESERKREAMRRAEQLNKSLMQLVGRCEKPFLSVVGGHNDQLRNR